MEHGRDREIENFLSFSNYRTSIIGGYYVKVFGIVEDRFSINYLVMVAIHV